MSDEKKTADDTTSDAGEQRPAFSDGFEYDPEKYNTAAKVRKVVAKEVFDNPSLPPGSPAGVHIQGTRDVIPIIGIYKRSDLGPDDLIDTPMMIFTIPPPITVDGDTQHKGDEASTAETDVAPWPEVEAVPASETAFDGEATPNPISN